MEPSEVIHMSIDRYGQILEELEKAKTDRDFYKEMCKDLIVEMNSIRKECKNLKDATKRLEEDHEYYSKEIKKI